MSNRGGSKSCRLRRIGVGLIAAGAVSPLACGKNNESAGPADASLSIDASLRDARVTGLADGLATTLDAPSADRALAPHDAADATLDASVRSESGPESGIDASPPTLSFVRLADFAPDAPASGYDFCLTLAGTTTWMGPLLASSFPRGSLGQGGANGIQFPWVSAYLGVPPGTYDLQLVAPGATDCQTGVIAPTFGLPGLVVGAHTTFAVVGNVLQRGSDAALKIAVFADDTTVTERAALRFINAISTVGYADVGTGLEMNGTFAPLVIDVAFATVGMVLADGGATDPNGYLTLAPVSGAVFSAHPTGVTTTDSDSATNVSLMARSVTTVVLLDSQNGRPQQFLACTETAPPNGAQSPCTVLPR
jgi:hypothetical protein